MQNEEDILKEAIKLYITGKNIHIKDKIKAKEFFLKSLEIIKDLKGVQNAQYSQLINSTEAECMKYLENANIFEMIKENDLENIKKIEHINFREINGDGNTILHYAIDIGDTGILKELLKKGGMIDTVNGNGNTLLEYACLKKDPNVIAFIILHGGNMMKHLFFRKGDLKFYLNKSDIDIAILMKLVVTNSYNKTDYASFVFLQKYFNVNELIGLDNYTIKDLMVGLHTMFHKKDTYDTYKKIILEELNEYEQNKNVGHQSGKVREDMHKCIYNMIDIVLISLVPFINYPFNISSIFIVKNEIKFLIKNILKNKDFKNDLMNKLFDNYIQPQLFPEDFIGIIVYNILAKN